MRTLLSFVLLVSTFLGSSFVSGQTKPAGTSYHPRSSHSRVTKPEQKEPKQIVSAKFSLWETQQDLRKRTGDPKQFYIPQIDRLISPDELEKYQNSYKKIYDVYYRDTPVQLVRVLVAYGKDDSRSHLEPETRVTHVYFIFDKSVALRDALAAIDEVRDLCTGGCLLNGFAGTVIAQPATPTEKQVLLARQMRSQWSEEIEMTDATPGVQVFYRDSPYPVDFERSPVERIDLTLVSNAGQEKYSVMVRQKEPTMLKEWHPHRQSDTAAPQ